MAEDSPRPAEKGLPRVGSYDLIQPLGSGGMSSVFRARHVETGLEVAIKILPRTLAKNPIVLQRFLREAKSAEALEHPSIVAIYDRGVDQGRHYLVLEYVDGGDLHDRVRADGPMSADAAVAVVRAVAEALRYAAGRGVIHRDIKPANVLMTTDGQVKVADLGLALHAEDEDERVTREGTTVGTVDYMAPEQARDSRATSIRSDIYSLGCMFHFLLIGQPPFPGGDVAEKLSRHINAPPPDVRQARPEVPEAVARLIQRMLAKKPERRFADYDELIAALDALKDGPAPDLPADGPTLTALFDDEDDGPGLVPVDDDRFVPLTQTKPPSTPDRPRRAASDPGLVPMAELALLDDSGEAKSLPAPRPRPQPPALSPPQPEPLGDLVPLDDEDEEDDDGPGPAGAFSVGRPGVRMPAAVRPQGGRPMSESERSWVLRWALLGLGLVLLVIAIDLVVRSTSTVESDDLSPEDPASAETEGPVSEVPAVVRPEVARAPAPAVGVPPSKPAAPERRSPPRFVEPADPEPVAAVEPPLGSGTEAGALPGWVVAPPAPPAAAKVVVVRRVPDASVPGAFSGLRAASEVAGATVIEVADNGPFFESELNLTGEGRVVRARAGYRPIVVLGRDRAEAVQGETSWLDVGEHSLTFEGLDLVVDVNGLPPTHTALFAGRGGSIVFRDCTLTVLDRPGLTRTYSLVRSASASAGPGRVLFDRSYVRGVYTSAVDVSTGPAEVVLLRSVVLNATGALASFGPAPAAGGPRWLSVVRSIALTWGPSLEINDTSPAPRAAPVKVRAFGSTFARFQAPHGAGLVQAWGDAPSASALLDWQGDANTFAGWSGFLVTGPSKAQRVANLAAARAAWPGSEKGSHESRQAWPLLRPSPQGVALDAFRPLAPDRAAVLDRVAVPAPTLLSKTLEEFPPANVPGLVTLSAAATAGSQAGPATTASQLASAKVAAEPGPAEHASAPGPSAVLGTTSTVPGTRELTFDTQAAPHQGDLGQYLAEKVKAGDRVVRVRVTGTGRRRWTPVRLPDGVSLDLVVEPAPGAGPPSWTAGPGGKAEALLEVHSGSLLLSGLDLTLEGPSAGPKHLVRVEDGHLALHRCRLTANGPASGGGGVLIDFQAAGSGPNAAPSVGNWWPFDRPVDRPTCRIVESVLRSSADALEAEVGRGLVALSHCVVIAGRSAIVSRPGKVARARLQADLALDHCTIAAERAVVDLGPWPGSVPGPDRPWLVSTVDCAVFGTFEGAAAPGLLLRSDPEALAHGAVFWQSRGDALELTAFIATADGAPAAPRRPNVQTQWVAFWGERHARSISGPHPQGGGAGPRPVVPLRPGAVSPGDLAIDPDSIDRRRLGQVGADLGRLGVTPTPRAGRKP